MGLIADLPEFGEFPTVLFIVARPDVLPETGVTRLRMHEARPRIIRPARSRL
jgi:hypothetical protein